MGHGMEYERAIIPRRGVPNTISVIINAGQRERYVSDALRSVNGQTFSRDLIETVVVSGKHDVLGRIASDEPQTLRVYNPSNFVGSHYASGIEASSGEIIALLDDDDEFLPTKLQIVSQLFAENSALDIYHHHRQYMNEQRTSIPAGYMYPRAERKLGKCMPILLSPPYGRRQLRSLTATDVLFNSSSLVFRRGFVLPLLSLLSQVELSVDSFLIMAAIARQRTVLVDGRRLTRYRIHSANVSQVGVLSGRASAPAHQRRGYEERLQADGEYIRKNLARNSDPDFARLADALVAVNGYYCSANFGAKGDQIRWALRILSRADTFVGRSHWLPALTVFAALPFPHGVQPLLNSARRLSQG